MKNIALKWNGFYFVDDREDEKVSLVTRWEDKEDKKLKFQWLKMRQEKNEA